MSSDENTKKWKRSIKYSYKRRVIEEELTADKFIFGLKTGMEYFFTYRNHTIDIAFHFEGARKIYEVNIDGYSKSPCYHTFLSVDELINAPILENKNILELWCDLET